MITRNGKTGEGWRLDELTEDGPTGMGFLMNPFAIVPDAANADRIVEAFRLLEEWRRTPFFNTKTEWEA